MGGPSVLSKVDMYRCWVGFLQDYGSDIVSCSYSKNMGPHIDTSHGQDLFCVPWSSVCFVAFVLNLPPIDMEPDRGVLEDNFSF